MIFNLTKNTKLRQINEAFVYNPTNIEEVNNLLIFTDKPNRDDLRRVAYRLAELVVKAKCTKCVIDCDLFLVSHLELALREKGIQPLYFYNDKVVVL